jgi:hypothetical protein
VHLLDALQDDAVAAGRGHPGTSGGGAKMARKPTGEPYTSDHLPRIPGPTCCPSGAPKPSNGLHRLTPSGRQGRSVSFLLG